MSQNPIITENSLTLDRASFSAQVNLRQGDIRWRIRSDWEQKLLTKDHPDWFNLEGDPRATQVKTGHLRSVWRVELGRDTLYAKIVYSSKNSLISRVRLALGKTASHREWHIGFDAMRRGAPVIRPVAFATRSGPSPASVLISEAFKNAKELSIAWQDAMNDTQATQGSSKKLTKAVADLYAAAHQSGFLHLDGHPGNILVASTNGEIAARFVDTTEAILSNGRPPWIQIIRSLAHLDHYMKRVATRKQRLRFLRNYLERLHVPQSHRHEIWMEHTMVPAIFAQEEVHAATLARQRDRRLTHPGKYFGRIALGGGWLATVVLDLERRHVFPEQGTPDFTETHWRELLSGIENDENGIETIRTRLAASGFSVRTQSAGGFLTACRWRILGSRAWRLFFRCHALRHRDIPAPLVLACLEHRSTTGGVVRTLLVYPANQEQSDQG